MQTDIVLENELRILRSFRGSVHHHHDRELGSMLVDVVLELRVLHLVGNRKSSGSPNLIFFYWQIFRLYNILIV